MNVTTVCYLYATVLCHLLCDENDWRSVIYSVIESKVVLADKFKKKKSLDYLIVSEQRGGKQISIWLWKIQCNQIFLRNFMEFSIKYLWALYLG